MNDHIALSTVGTLHGVRVLAGRGQGTARHVVVLRLPKRRQQVHQRFLQRASRLLQRLDLGRQAVQALKEIHI